MAISCAKASIKILDLATLTELKISDRGVREYEFYTRAEEGYSRTLPEVTLHQVLRKLMRLLERDLDQNRRNLEAKVDTTLLHPPVLPEAEHFYPPEMGKMKEYTEYFASKAKRAERTDRLAYKFQGNTRPADALDALFRGTGSTSKEANMAATLALYKPDPKAGESAHSKIGWKSNLATNDLLAVADPRAAAKAKEVENLFRAQGAWTHKQKKDMEQRNDRFEHLVHIIRNELKAEHEREARELTGDSKKVTRQAQMDVFLERLKAVDHLIKVLSLYKLSGPIEDSDLVIFQLRKWQQTLRDRVQAKARAAGKRQPRRQRGGTASTARSGTASTAGTWDGGDDEDGADGDDEGEGGGGGSDGLGLESLDAMAPKTSIKAGAVKSNAMIAKGENPYYEADVYIDKNKRLARKLAKQGNFNPNQPPRYLDSIKSPGGRSPSPSRSRPASPRQQEANAAAATAADKDGEGSSIASSQEEGDDLASAANGANATAGLGVFLSAAQGNAAKARKQREEIAANVAQSAADVKELRERDARKAARKAAGWKPKSFVHKYARHQREIDAEEMAAARKTFEEVDFGHHVRQGNRFDLAYLKPALIPVPGAFEGDGKHTLQSYEGEKIVGRARKALVSDLGYTPQRLLPLYVRNTLLEPNGTTPGGDQTQEVMALDRRYSHYVGRPLNRFEPGKELADSKAFLKSSKGFGPNAKELAERLAPIKAERAAKAKAKRIEEMQYHPLNRSLVRVVFGLPIPSVNDVVFQES